ncbi:hypothetical protein [Streptomyces phaeoluteigriseus]|uniref:hypothetical protein n=1 Tax=Streptomyces phaeoluteigriseus TaxID=114686 RepID=UPI0036AF50D4
MRDEAAGVGTGHQGLTYRDVPHLLQGFCVESSDKGVGLRPDSFHTGRDEQPIVRDALPEVEAPAGFGIPHLIGFHAVHPVADGREKSSSCGDRGRTDAALEFVPG